ncbi:hypothetical protein HCB27_16925 [Listeria booriae]|uniref:Uncharacterized protein n=1 Tax=Listeria booriae TaxID=1552123 RepID=A0A7X0ZA23_9LIST|nr:hypothetical protein [Listeria booriae]MBC2178159.1 hypothetical protein [Listeria booriae]MBC2178314.1 hypothetical protein [Listeria booriae]
MKIIGIHPSGRSIVIEYKGTMYRYETSIGKGQESTLSRAKFSARYESFTATEKRQGMDVGSWKWREVYK